MGITWINAVKTLTFLNFQNCQLVFPLPLVQWSSISIFCNFFLTLVTSSSVHTTLYFSLTVLFSWAKKYLHVSSSMFLGMFTVRTKCVLEDLACTKRLFKPSGEATINVSNVHPGVKCGKFSWRTNKFIFLEVWPSTSFFRRDTKINSRYYWKCLLSWNVLFTTKVCLFPYIERERWKLFRMFLMRGVLLRFDHS